MSEAMIDHALVYAAAYDWPVFPVNGKVPRVRNGLHDATVDAERIGRWWDMWPNAGIAVRTGKASNLLVLDVDAAAEPGQPDGREVLRDHELEHGDLPRTPCAVTGSGGAHYYFAYPGVEVRNSADERLGGGLHVRAEGGYVVAPPSSHPSGRSYGWDVPPGDFDPAPLPDWILESATKRRDGPRRTRAEWRQLIDSDAHPNARHDSLKSIAGYLVAKLEDGRLAWELLQGWNLRHCKPPKPEREVTEIIIWTLEQELRDGR